MKAWHIFKKDFGLLWPLALAGVAANALLTRLRFHSATYHDLHALAALSTLALLLTAVLSIVLAVQQESLLSVHQDWLTRPIERRDLLLAKLLDVLLLVQVPMMAFNFVAVLAEGFSLHDAVQASVLSAIKVAWVFTLPVMAIAALTKSLTETLLGALAVAAGLVLVYLAMRRMLVLSYPVEGTGVEWVWGMSSQLCLVLAIVVALLLQYFRRRTTAARAVFAGGLLLFMLVPALPWRPAFALQQRLSRDPRAADAVSIAYDPTLKPKTAMVVPSTPLLVDHDGGKEKKKEMRSGTTMVALPLRVSNLPEGTVVHADRTVIRLTDARGETVYRGIGAAFDAASGGGARPIGVLQGVEIPEAVLHRGEKGMLRLEVGYSLTLLRARRLPPLSALAEDTLPDVGHCVSARDHEPGVVDLSCRIAGEEPACVSAQWVSAGEGEGEGGLGSGSFACTLNYRPAVLAVPSDPIDQVDLKLRFVGAFDPRAKIALDVFEPIAHFSRRLIVPEFRLQD